MITLEVPACIDSEGNGRFVLTYVIISIIEKIDWKHTYPNTLMLWWNSARLSWCQATTEWGLVIIWPPEDNVRWRQSWSISNSFSVMVQFSWYCFYILLLNIRLLHKDELWTFLKHFNKRRRIYQKDNLINIKHVFIYDQKHVTKGSTISEQNSAGYNSFSTCRNTNIKFSRWI